MLDDKRILGGFQKAINIHGDKKLIDLDRQLKDFDFLVLRFEDVFKGTRRSVPPNMWSFYRIGLLTKGSAEFNSGMYRFTARKNTLMVMPPRMITASHDWSLDAQGYVVLFNLNFFIQRKFPPRFFRDKKVLQTAIQPYARISPQKSDEISEIFEAILAERSSLHEHNTEMIAVKMIELIILCERIFTDAGIIRKSGPVADIVKKFNDLLEANFTHEHSVAFYASRLNFHPNYLNSLIKKNTGFTAKESIQNRLMIEIKYLLHTTGLSIKEIAGQTGFSDPDYFTSFFKRAEKISPAGYRASFI